MADITDKKIRLLETQIDTTEPKVILQIIEKLGDDSIRVRGEAFSSLVLNKNDIAKQLISSLDSKDKHIRGFVALVLANRGDDIGVADIARLVKDHSAMVRECALGALGFLKADSKRDVICSCFSDDNIDVKKSALKAALDIKAEISVQELDEISKDTDSELVKLLERVKIRKAR